jgi:hypothetical protein
LASSALLKTLRLLLENVLQNVDHSEEALEKPRNRMGRDMDYMADVLMGFHRSTFTKLNTEFNSDLSPMRFMGFSNNEKGAPRQEISK